jgi:hypothetical protein
MLNSDNRAISRQIIHDIIGKLTLFVSCVSIMKLCTCFSARVSSSFRETTATSSAVHPAPCGKTEGDETCTHECIMCVCVCVCFLVFGSK